MNVTASSSLKGASYSRVSTLGQMKDNNGNIREDSSPEAQKQRCIRHTAYLTDKNGKQYKLIEHITDEGFSAKNTKRPGYQRMLDLVASGTIDFIVSPELSRLSRNVLDFLELVSHCEKYKVDIIVIGLDLDTSAAFGRMMVVILVALAQFEREMTSSRVKENALVRLLQDGKINGAAEILGLDRDSNRKGHFLKNFDELIRAEKVLKLFMRFSSRKKTVEEARKLGLTGKKGRQMTGRILDSMLHNVRWRYRGCWYANLENKGIESGALPESKRFQTVELPHGPLLDKKLLDEVQSKIDDTRKNHKQSGKDGYVYLLKHFLFHEDGSRFQSEPSKGRQYRYYLNKKNKLRLRCDKFDPLIINEVKQSFAESKRFKELVEKSIRQRQSELPKIEGQIRGAEKELVEIDETNRELQKQLTDKDQRAQTGFMEWLGDQVEEITRRQRDLKNELELLKKHKIELLRDCGLEDIRGEAIKLLKDFDGLTGTQKRRLLERVIQKIVVDQAGKVKIYMYGEAPRASVTLRKKSSELKVNGGVEGTRTLDLRRDRPAL